MYHNNITITFIFAKTLYKKISIIIKNNQYNY